MIAGLKPYPAMKDSGVPWLGEVPEHWNRRALKRLCDRSALYGANIPASEYVPIGVRFLRTTDITDDGDLRRGGVFVGPAAARGYMLSDGDLLVSRSGTIGRSLRYRSQIHGPCAYAGYLVRFVPAAVADPDYLFYFSKSVAFGEFIRVSAVASTIENVNGDKYANMPLSLPPLPEQTAIVRFLDHADRRIRRYIRIKQKLIKLLEEQKQAIIHRAVTRGLDPNVRLKPSGVEWLGDVPEHWEVTRFGRLVELTTGFPFKSEGFTHSIDDIRLLRGINISPGRLRWNDVVRWPVTERDDLGDYQLRPGDVVLGMDRPIVHGGVRVAVIGILDVPSLLLQRVARIRPRQKLLTEFVVLLLAGRTFSNHLEPIFTGISVPHLSPEQIKSYQLAIPNLDEQERIVEHVALHNSVAQTAIERTKREISLLREYRTRLIVDVVTGKLDVREAAAKLPNEPDEPEPLDAPEERNCLCTGRTGRMWSNSFGRGGHSVSRRAVSTGWPGFRYLQLTISPGDSRPRAQSGLKEIHWMETRIMAILSSRTICPSTV